MVFQNNLLMASASAGGVFQDLGGCYFDGGDWYLRTSDYDGLVNGKVGTISVWFRQNVVFDGSGTARYPFQNIYGSLHLYMGSSNRMRIALYGSSSYIWSVYTSVDSFKSTEGWVHFVTSWDLGNTVGHVYVNGVSDQASVTAGPTDEEIDYTKGKWGWGASSTPSGPINGDMAQWYFNSTEYIDLSVASNLKKFYDGGPVDLGSDGSTPTGTAPIMFINRTATGAVTEFNTNAGTGGDMVLTGTLTESSNIPFPGLVA
jgi:hypothetical protein